FMEPKHKMLGVLESISQASHSLMGSRYQNEKMGARMGHRVTIRKLEKELEDGTRKRTHPHYRWRATFVETGERKQKYFKTKKEAEDWAEKHEEEALAHGTEAMLTSAERATVVDTRKDLEEVGLTLRDAVNSAVDQARRALESCTVSEMIRESIESRKRSGTSSRHLRDMKGKLGRFEEAFGSRSVVTLTSQEIGDWLYGLKLAPASINSYRRILVVAFNDAKRNGHLDKNPAELVRQAKVVETEVGILTPQEAALLLSGAEESIKPAIALGLFAGLRMVELERIDWDEVHLDVGHVRIAAGKAKSARNRIVPISENLGKWLKLHKKSSGSVWPESHQRGRKKMEAAHNAAGFGTAKQARDTKGEKNALRKWPDNGLRHSYATYHLAHHANAHELALHMGHTNTALIFAHYRLPVTKKLAVVYWSIDPDNAEEIAKGEEGE
ncbi:MAG: tyrosine-type recombinase/integrase, partial [Verrucomicrobiales bacterium]